GAVAGTLAATTIGERLFNLMFEGMFGGFETLGQGTSRIDFATNPLLAYGLLPAVLLGAVALATVASSRSISTATISPHHRVKEAVMTTVSSVREAPRTSTTILDAQGLTKAFGSHTVLHQVNVQIHDGEFVSVMGPSGSGKSTLLYNISGMDTMTSGKVRYAG